MSEVLGQHGYMTVSLVTVLIILPALAAAFVTTLAFCRIFAKAGFHWAVGLLLLVPVISLFALLYLAFADWPVLQELRPSGQFPGSPA